ncbi:MAG: response regulator [Victivallales bacterium]|jgi:adenylate cyclase|nr:response regulator [Victivallales bacterium]
MKGLSERTVLIVDDTETNIDILVEALGEDYEVSVAMDGESALEAVAEERPDLILLDVMMPGIDGYEVCQRLKASDETKDIPIIFLTALTEVRNKTRGFELGAVDYVTKPFEMLEVGARVRTHLELVAQREKSEQLLANVLPRKVIEDLKETGDSRPQLFKDVTILFSDIADFTRTSSALTPDVVIAELSSMFTAFDAIMAENGCERIKTIGDAYLAVCGMPIPDANHARKMVKAAQRMIAHLEDHNRTTGTGPQWQIRVGIHSGEVVGGIVGTTKYVYDVFGDAVNTASRAEQASEPMRVTVTEPTYELTKDAIVYEKRGPIEMKGKGHMPLYFVDE